MLGLRFRWILFFLISFFLNWLAGLWELSLKIASSKIYETGLVEKTSWILFLQSFETLNSFLSLKFYFYFENLTGSWKTNPKNRNQRLSKKENRPTVRVNRRSYIVTPVTPFWLVCLIHCSLLADNATPAIVRNSTFDRSRIWPTVICQPMFTTAGGHNNNNNNNNMCPWNCLCPENQLLLPIAHEGMNFVQNL